MQIKKSELRNVIKEQVAAFFVTPQPFGTVSRNTNLAGSLRKFGTKDVDEKELKKVIKQTMGELEEEASTRMQAAKLKEAGLNGTAKGHGTRVKEVEQHWMKQFESILKRKAPKLVGQVEDARAQYMQTMGYTPEDAVKDIIQPGSLERSNHSKMKNSNCVEGMIKETKKKLTKKTDITEISGVDSLKPNDPHTPEDEAEKDAADDVMEAGPKPKGGRPRGGPHIENVRFWDLEEKSLRYIIKDASQAVAANPTARKAGKWADEVNDAVTVLYWRKKKGIKEGTRSSKLGGLSSKILNDPSTIKMVNPKNPREIFVIVSRFGSKGITSAAAQDKVSMVVVDKTGRALKDWGSHVNAKAALKFAKSRGYTKKIDESFNTAPAGQGKEQASVISRDDNETNEAPEIGSLASSPKSKAIIKKMHDLVTKQLKFKTVEDIQPIQGGVAFIFGDKAEASKMARYLKKKGALGKVLPLAGGTGKRTMVSLRAK